MEFIELAKERISCRSYQQESISSEVIMKLLEAAHNAPSAGNIQPWYFYVIVDRKVIKDMEGKVYSQDWIADAPVIIIACTDREASEKRYGERGRDVYAYMDCAAAIQNLLLCASDLGLGSCWVGDFNIEECRKIIHSDQYTPVALITVGHSKNPQVKAHKKAVSEIYTIIGENEPYKIEEISNKLEMKHCDISYAVFEDVNLHQCSIQNANMFQAKFNDINLKEATINACNLEGVQITNCLVDGLTNNGKKVKV